jgi:hypothetical protein
MIPNMMKTPIDVDRLATADEICAAVSPFPDPIEECAAGIRREIVTDVGGYVGIPAVDFEISLMVEELTQEQDAWPN